MAQFKVIITPQALNQLYRIVNYIQKQGSNQNATIIYNGLIEAIESLKIMPKRNPVYRTVGKKRYEYRYQPKWSFNIIYRIEEAPPKVYIVTIAAAARDRAGIEAMLG